MYCSKCGNEILDEAVVCPKCGCLLPGKSFPKTNGRARVASENPNTKSYNILNIISILLLVSLIPFLVFASRWGVLCMIFPTICLIFLFISLVICIVSIVHKNNMLEVFKHVALIITLIFSFLVLIFFLLGSYSLALPLVGIILTGILTAFEVVAILVRIVEYLKVKE